MKNIKIIAVAALMFLSSSSVVSAQVVTDSSLLGDGTSLTPLSVSESFAHFWDTVQNFVANGIGAAKTPAVSLTNSTSATTTIRNEYPPAINFLGTAYGGGASNIIGWRIQPSSTTATRGFSLMPELDFDATYDGSTWDNMLSMVGNSGSFNKRVVINNTLNVGYGNNTSLAGSLNTTGDIQTSGTNIFAGSNGSSSGVLGLEGAISGTWFFSVPSTVTNYNTFVPSAQGDANSVWSNDGAGHMSNTIMTSGSFSDTGSSTTTFTVNIGQTMPSTTYKVTMTPTDANSASLYFVTNKTATTFDVEYLSPITGSVGFDYFIYQ